MREIAVAAVCKVCGRPGKKLPGGAHKSCGGGVSAPSAAAPITFSGGAGGSARAALEETLWNQTNPKHREMYQGARYVQAEQYDGEESFVDGFPLGDFSIQELKEAIKGKLAFPFVQPYDDDADRKGKRPKSYYGSMDDY